MSLRLYLDEDVDVLLAELLRRDGHDALTTRDAGRAGGRHSDEGQLAFAASQGRSVLSHNVRDFVMLATTWAEQGREHSGIILSPRRPVTELRARLEVLFGRYPDGMAGVCDFL